MNIQTRKKIDPLTRLNKAIENTCGDELKFVGVYPTDESSFNACMQIFKNRSFIYILALREENEIQCLYVGKSQSQYARMLDHQKNFDFDVVLLYECEKDILSKCEKQVIELLTPIYNIEHNPKAQVFRNLLGIKSESKHNRENTIKYMEAYETYNKMGTYCYALPAWLNFVVESLAKENNVSANEQLRNMLESMLDQKVILDAINTPIDKLSCVNFLSVNEYANLYGKSPEQIKQYLHKERIVGAVKWGRDWIISQDAEYPEDKRRK